MANIVSRGPHPNMSGAELIRFDDGTTQTVQAGALPQFAPRPQPVNYQPQDPSPEYQQAQGAARSQMTPYGLPLQDVQAIASRPVYQPGRAAYDPNKEIATQVAVPTGVQTQTTGAKPFDKDVYLEAQTKEREAQQAKADADMLAASNDAATQRAMAHELQGIQSDQQAKQQAAEDRYNSNMLQLTGDAQKVAMKETKPDRVFENMSGLSKMLFAISAGLNGYATQGKSNATLDMMQNMMAADINAQQNQINREQGQADNALSRLSHQWGSLEAGRSALKVQQLEVIKQKLGAQAAEIGTARAKANADAQAKLLEAQQMRELAVLQNAARGQTTETTVSQMRTPISGAAGGLRAPTEAEIDKRITREQTLRKSGQDIVGGGLKNEAAAAELNGAIPNDKQMKLDENIAQRQEHLGKSLSEIANLRTNVDTVISKGGITEDEQGYAKHNGIPGIGMWYNALEKIPVFGKELASLAANAAGKDSSIVRNQSMEALTYKIQEASGAAFSEAEAARHAQALGQAALAGEDTFAQAMVNFRKSLDEKEQSLRAGAGLSASRAYDAAKGQLKDEARFSKAGIVGKYEGTVSK